MRSPLRVPLLAALLVACAAAPCAAEWQLTPFLGYTFGGTTTLVELEGGAGKRHWHLGGAVTLLGDGPLGVEAIFIYTPGFFQQPERAPIDARITSSRSTALLGNIVLAAPRRWTQYGLRPYVSGGLGLLHASANDLLNIFPIDVDLLAMNAGGGAVGFVSDRVGLRFDLRYLRNIRGVAEEDLTPAFGPVRLRYWTGSVGVVFRFPAPRPRRL